MSCQQVIDLAGHLHAGANEDDQVVADPLQVGDQMRREHYAYPVPGHDLHEALEELASGKRVEACHGLI